MRPLFILGMFGALGFSGASGPAPQETGSVATVSFADGTTVALVEWKLTYEFATWNKKDPVSLAKTHVRESAALVAGKKSYPVAGSSLALTYTETSGAVRVASLNLTGVGDIRMEVPSQYALAPDLDKHVFFQPRSLDLSGKTLSGVARSFCVASLSLLVECGGSEATRVVRIDFN